MSSPTNFHTSLIILALFSIILGAAILGTAGHVLHTFNSQQGSNPWWLPVWPAHFDSRGLRALLGCSVTIVVLNGLLIGGTSARRTSSKLVVLVLSVLATIAALVSIIMPAVINNAAPGTDSMQTWTCEWGSTKGAPSNFKALCHENRFAYFASIPLFVAQLLFLGLAVQNLFARSQQQQHRKMEEEKGEELDSMVAMRTESRDGLESAHSGKESVIVKHSLA